MLVSETWTFDWTGIFSGCRDQSFASNSASILSMREFERPAWRNCLKSATPLAAQVSVALTRMSRGARRSEAISSPASNRRPRLLMGSGPLCSASNYSAARANAIGGETALQHMHHQSRHACPAAFARLTAVAQQKIYGWKSLGSNVNGVTAVIVIRSLPE